MKEVGWARKQPTLTAADAGQLTMKPLHLAGAGLGLVAAVVFASATTGPLFIRFLLIFITPLPIALAGLGWGWRAAVLAGVTGGGIILLLAGPLGLRATFIGSGIALGLVLTYVFVRYDHLRVVDDTLDDSPPKMPSVPDAAPAAAPDATTDVEPAVNPGGAALA